MKTDFNCNTQKIEYKKPFINSFEIKKNDIRTYYLDFISEKEIEDGFYKEFVIGLLLVKNVTITKHEIKNHYQCKSNVPFFKLINNANN